MVRWIWIAVTLIALIVAISTQSASTLGWAMFIAIVAAFGAVFAFAAARIETRAQLQVYVPTPQEAALLKARGERQAAARGKSAPASGRGNAPAANAGRSVGTEHKAGGGND